MDGNQPYDMLVVDDQNNEIERIEVTKVIDGHSAHKSMVDLIDNGITMLPPNNENASDMLKTILSKKQSKGDYVNCKLVIYLVEGELALYNPAGLDDLDNVKALNDMIKIIQRDADNTFTGIFLVERSSPGGNPTKIVYAHYS